jgi:hypothetical protein
MKDKIDKIIFTEEEIDYVLGLVEYEISRAIYYNFQKQKSEKEFIKKLERKLELCKRNII